MEVRDAKGDGFSLTDGAALVVGAAVASVHLRAVVPRDRIGAGWALIGIVFAGVALTAAGPIIFLIRRFGRRAAGHPRLGDWLWALLGLPWLVTCALRSA